MRMKDHGMDNQYRETVREIAWKHLIAGADEDECISALCWINDKIEYLRTIKPMLKGKFLKN